MAAWGSILDQASRKPRTALPRCLGFKVFIQAMAAS